MAVDFEKFDELEFKIKLNNWREWMMISAFLNAYKKISRDAEEHVVIDSMLDQIKKQLFGKD